MLKDNNKENIGRMLTVVMFLTFYITHLGSQCMIAKTRLRIQVYPAASEALKLNALN